MIRLGSRHALLAPAPRARSGDARGRARAGAHALGCEFVQVNLHHVRDRDVDGSPRARRSRARRSGSSCSPPATSSARRGTATRRRSGIGRVHAWLERAVALGSPVLRVVSGFYRAELDGQPDVIEAERRYVVAVLRGALPAADAAGVALLRREPLRLHGRRVPLARGRRRRLDRGLPRPDQPDRRARRPACRSSRALAPLARAGHVKDYVFESIPTDDGYHRRGFAVRYRYPGEGVADLAGADGGAARGPRRPRLPPLGRGARQLRRPSTTSGERLAPSLELLRRLTA